ncbi:MAG: hypothetical protein WC891_06590 [Actinomycetota bacterium]
MAVNIKRTSMAAAALVAVIVIMIAAPAGLAYWISGGIRSELDSLKERVAVLEKQLSAAGASSAAPSTTNTPTGSSANTTDYEDWATYENTSIGYAIRYPDGWTYNEESYEVDGKPVVYVVFVSPDKQYYVSIGLKKKGAETILTGRSGVGTGDMKAAGTITVLGVKVKRTEQIYKSEVKGYFYPEVGKVFEAAGYQGYAEFGKMTAANTDKYNLEGIGQASTAEKIISSLSVTPGQ